MKSNKDFNDFCELQEAMTKVAKESPTYKKLALYIEKNYLQVIFMTAQELAEKSGVSQGSVSRFFISFGYSGYNEFLRSLQRLVSKQLTAPERLRYSADKAVDNNPWQSIISRELENMNTLPALLTGEAYEKMLAMVTSPKKLILLSARMSATILPYVEYILQKMRGNVVVVTPDCPEWESLLFADPQDVNILVVSFPRYPRTLIKQVELLKNKGFALTALTDSRFSPIVELVDGAVYVSVTTASLFDIYSTPMVFFNLLLQDAAKRMSNLDKRMEAIEQYEKRNNIYFTA